jgi:phospholipase C
VQDGQKFVYDIVNAVITRPVFAHTVMFLTWDENGGFYDHVPPPRACDPTVQGDQVNAEFQFDNYGFRVPLIVISPFAKQGYVSHYLADHTSLVRFVEHWQNKGAMTARDANAWPLLDMFDFNTTRTVLSPDPALAIESTDPVHVGACGAGGTGLP